MYGEVQTTEVLTPSMIRVRFGGHGLDTYEPATATDQYINAQFLPPGSQLTVPFEKEQTAELAADQKPRSRRYTVRHWDADARILTIDFVAHGAVGYAGPWAQSAKPGDRLQFSNPRGNYSPDPDAAWHLLAGDESALPAIAASLEALAPTAQGVVLVVVESAEHELELTAPEGVSVTWLHRTTSNSPEQLLLDAIVALEFAAGPVDVFVHGEAGEVRAVRKHLVADRGLVWDDMSISPYWRRGRDDEAWREIKRSWAKEERAELQK